MAEDIEYSRVLSRRREIEYFSVSHVWFRAFFSFQGEYGLPHFFSPGKKPDFPVAPPGPAAFTVDSENLNGESIDPVFGLSHITSPAVYINREIEKNQSAIPGQRLGQE